MHTKKRRSETAIYCRSSTDKSNSPLSCVIRVRFSSAMSVPVVERITIPDSDSGGAGSSPAGDACKTAAACSGRAASVHIPVD